VRDKATYLSESSLSVIASSPLFADLDDATIALIVASFTEEVWPAGHIVIEELAPGDTLYIIMDGQVQISRTFQDGKRRVIREMGPGEFFGEMALLEDKPRSARVSTVTPTTFLAVTRLRFNTLIEQHPAVAINFLNSTVSKPSSCKKSRRWPKLLPPKMLRWSRPWPTCGQPWSPSPSTNVSNAIWKLPARSSARCFPPRFHRLRACACTRLRCQLRGSGAICMMPYASTPTG
jgi:hypothetical protein